MNSSLVIFAIYGIALLTLLFFRGWIAMVLGLVGLAGLHFFLDSASVAGYLAFGGLDSFTLTAIPLFILMGEFMLLNGVSELLYDGLGPFMERFVPGGLIQANIVACGMFGAVCGSAIAGSAAIGTVAIPYLRKRKYHPALAAASLAAGGPLSVIIPPSLSFIIIGSLTNVSVGKLFIAGILPGTLLTGLFVVTTAIILKAKPTLVPAKSYVSTWDSVKGLAKITPMLIVAAALLYAIYGGIATPTEVASVGTLLALLTGLVNRKLKWPGICNAIRQATKLTGVILFLYIGASIFGFSLANLGLPALIRSVLLPMPVRVILVIVCVAYLILGCFLDALAAILITTPIVFPLFLSLGYDPVWIGVVICLLTAIGIFTPPVGMTLYVIQGISGVDLMKIFIYAVPFVIASLVNVGIVILVPGIATLLPNLMG